jgi:hypothetical protein
MRTATRLTTCVAAAVSMLLLATTAIAQAPGGEPETSKQLADVRRVTAKYHDLERAHADGYQPGSPCVPHMGYHYVRSIAADQDELDPTAPNILIYAPRPDGRLRLVAVEYASRAPATLFGRTFDPPGPAGPPFHTLHAWVWQANPDGTFAAHNRNISCGS